VLEVGKGAAVSRQFRGVLYRAEAFGRDVDFSPATNLTNADLLALGDSARLQHTGKNAVSAVTVGCRTRVTGSGAYAFVREFTDAAAGEGEWDWGGGGVVRG